MVECCICGQEIGTVMGGKDYDEALRHAWEYHFDIADSFKPEEVREMVLRKGIFNQYVKKGLIKNE